MFSLWFDKKLNIFYTKKPFNPVFSDIKNNEEGKHAFNTIP